LWQSPPLRAAAHLASAAHERIDASGYHRSLPGPASSRAARVLAAADAAHAMSEERPHRPARTASDLERELVADQRAGRLDRDAVAAVLAALGVSRKAEPTRTSGLSERELEVLRLVARGKTNREIATLLGISAKTVQHHVAHVYDKLGLYSRAGAAVYVMEHGLA
jgi:DNA-binding NarL/FixJ family response regulator